MLHSVAHTDLHLYTCGNHVLRVTTVLDARKFCGPLANSLAGLKATEAVS